VAKGSEQQGLSKINYSKINYNNGCMGIMKKRNNYIKSQINIIESCASNKEARIHLSYVISLISILLYVSLFGEIKVEMVAIVSTIAILFFVNNKLLRYRVVKGYYGSDESEVREILSFIFKEIQYLDKGNNGKSKKIFYDSASYNEIIERIQGLRERLSY